VKRGESDIKKFLLLSLLVTYLFIVLAYLFYLPKYSSLQPQNNYTRANTHLSVKAAGHVKHSSGNMLVLLHHVYRSTVENKREVLNNLLQKATLLASLLIGGVTLFNLFSRTGRYSGQFPHLHRHVYLSYCTLRI